MTRSRKSLEEQLAEIQAKQERVKARLAELELRRKARDRRLRLHGERVLLRLVLQRMGSDGTFTEAIQRTVNRADLRPNEREAVLWLMESGAADASATAAGMAEEEPVSA